MINDYFKILIISLTILGNQQLYSFKSSKILKKLFVNVTYNNYVVIYILAVYKLLKQIIKLFALNFFLIIILLLIPLMAVKMGSPSIYLGLIITMPIIALLSIKTFKATEKKYNIVYMMKYDAKRYCFFEIVKYLVYLTIIMIPPLLLAKTVTSEHFLTQTLYYFMNTYLLSNLLLLYFYGKTKKVLLDSRLYLFVLAALVLTPLGFAKLGISVPYIVYKVLNIIFLILNIIMIIWYHKSNVVYKLYKERFSSYEAIIDDDELVAARLDKQISIELEKDERIEKENGYKFFNDLFMLRHKNILKGSTKVFSIALIILFITLGILTRYFKELKDFIDKLLNTNYFTILYIIFVSNQGQKIIRAMFFHCDNSMLKYNFYRNKNTMFKLYKLRILSLLKINIPISIILTIGLDIIYVLTSKYTILNLVLLSLASIVASNFFSIYYISLYYLIQPFTSNMKDRNFKFNLVIIITFYLIFTLTDFTISLTISTISTILGSIVLVILFIVAVKLFCHKTFKLRKE